MFCQDLIQNNQTIDIITQYKIKEVVGYWNIENVSLPLLDRVSVFCNSANSITKTT